MAWALESGGDPDPRDAPAVPAGYGTWLDAFWHLSTDRPIGFGPAPIPHGAILRYMDAEGIDDLDDRACFTAAIRAMDEVWLEFAMERRDAQPGAPPPKAKPRVSKREMTPQLFDSLFGAK